MSALKYQLQSLLPSLAAQARACQDKEIKRRLYFIKKVVFSEKQISSVCRSEGRSRETLYKWGRKLVKSKTLEALSSKSRRPKQSPNQISQRIERKIRVLKNKRPFEGPQRISQRLFDTHKIKCPPSTTYAVLRRNKLISKEYRQQRTKKHMKRYRQPLPGFLQIDFKYVPYPVSAKQYYQLSAVDHCTSWRLIRVYKNLGIESAKNFLEQLNDLCPFPIFQIQTDNDVSFTDKFTVGLGTRPTGTHPFDEWCKYYGCKHKLIPVGEKEINGKVENTHKWDDEEFYSQHYPKSFEELDSLIRDYNENWNERRKTKALNWKTPNQTLYHVAVLCLAWLIELYEKYYQPIPATPQNDKKPPEKPKPLSPENRYLTWMDWETAQYPKYSLLYLSSMSRIFSDT